MGAPKRLAGAALAAGISYAELPYCATQLPNCIVTTHTGFMERKHPAFG